MKKIFFGIIFLFAPALLYSQGFDWQYSARLPFSAPKYFLGLQSSADFLEHYGDIRSMEKLAICAEYKSGSGTGMNVGAFGEYWYSGVMALYGGLSYRNMPANFSSQSAPVPLANGKSLVTRYEYSTNLQYLVLSAGGRYRLFETHFSLGAGLDAGFLLGVSGLQKESVISPAEYQFHPPGQEPTQSLEISRYDITNARKIILSPHIRLSYDLPLALGLYASPTLSFSWPLTSLSADYSWYQKNFSFGIAIVKSID